MNASLPITRTRRYDIDWLRILAVLFTFGLYEALKRLPPIRFLLGMRGAAPKTGQSAGQPGRSGLPLKQTDSAVQN